MRLPASIEDFVEQQRRTGLLWAPIFFAVGVGVYFGLKAEPPAAFGWTIAVLGVLGVLLTTLRAWPVPVALLGLALAGFGVAQLQTELHRAPVLAETYWGPVSGRVVGLDRSATNRIRVLLDQVHIPRIARADTPERVRLVLMTPPAPGTLVAGARVMTTARMTPPPPPVEPGGFDFRRHAWYLEIGAIGSAPHPLVLAAPERGMSLATRILDLRFRLADAIRARMPERTGPFAAAILTGDRSAIDPNDLVDLRASNLAHLLAISGLHMGLLSGFVFAMLRYGLALIPFVALRLPVKKIAALAALVAGAGYLAISGASVATQRAFVMCAVVLIGVALDRPALTLRAVAVAAMIVLIWRPVSLVSPGFQMSFAATIGLVWCFEMLKRVAVWQAMDRGRGRYLKPVLAVVVTSAVAGAATAPFSAFHFNQLTQYGLIANLLAVPAMGLLVMPAAVLTLILTPLGLDGIGFALMHFGIAHILNVAEWVGDLDGAVWPVASAPGWVLTLFSLGALLLVVPRGRARAAGPPVAAVALAFWITAERPHVLVAPAGSLVGVMTAEGRALSKPRGDGFAARVWLENDGDPVDQKRAAGRELGADGWQPPVLWITDGVPAESACSGGAVVIAPKLKAPGGECLWIGSEELAEGGALAVYAGRPGKLVSAAAIAGQRPWTVASQ